MSGAGAVGFLAELRRRSVFRVAGVYAVVAWLVAQVAVVLETALALPAWFDASVVAVLLLGFPVALVLAWAFELSPEGLKRNAPADAAARGSAPGVGLMDVALVAAVAVIAGASLYQAFSSGAPAERVEESVRVAESVDPIAELPPAPPVADDRLSIAVLPFADLSPEGDQEYFSDGLSEELLNELAQVNALRVISRTSSFAFKGRNVDIREVATALGVAHVLEGSVRKSGDQLRITAQLIDADDGSHLWSETYDRALDDVFVIQEDIARAVAEALSVTLGVGTSNVRTGTNNLEAYDAYLRARSWFAQGNLTSTAQTVELLREAVTQDPTYVDAYLLLSEAAGTLALMVEERREERWLDSAAALERAAALAPDDWRALQMVSVLRSLEGDLSGAVEVAHRARELAPAHEKVCLGPGFTNVLADGPARLACARADVEADPLSLLTQSFLQAELLARRRYDEAAAAYERGRALPGWSALAEYLELLRILRVGTSEQAAAQYQRYLEVEEVTAPVVAQMAELTDDRDASRAALRDAFDDPAHQDPAVLAILSSLALAYEDYELAVAMWRRLSELRGSAIGEMWGDVAAPARRLPAFKEFVRELGYVDYWRESGNWISHCRPVGADDFECS